ncbi:substrate import-associated zinc metallohydrolase lipoprotein [Capnocytophaga gingivalis]|jgi:hypothetical protein|uniref:substrate import-associated zinc metallohydrolase lipoprotein n=1 Tax=Capnocytophaga gingivalis TaxID=1017 RepID=UPI0023F9903A|nr:substrate import-associated zinc metallohydrolase lipoprotein [Capnocytophaga gingivalis]
MKKICIIPFLALFLFSCQKDNPDKDNSVVQLTTKEQAKNQSELDRYINQKLTIPYNVNINYRYPENDINRNQFTYVTPPSTQKALEMVNLIDYMYYQPYSKVVPKKFMEEYVTKQITLIGSYAYAREGGTYNGLATAGIRLELLGVNYIEPNTHDDSKRKDMDNNLLRLIYHETSHILEQNKQIPPEYEKLCAAEYKGGSWTRSWNLTTQNYLKSGFISPYSSDNVHEDFVEFIAHYIVFYQKNQCGCETTDATADTDGDGLDDAAYTAWKTQILKRGFIWEEALATADGKNKTDAQYTGKEILLKKLEIVKNYFSQEFGVDLEKLRKEVQAHHVNLPNLNFSTYNW